MMHTRFRSARFTIKSVPLGGYPTRIINSLISRQNNLTFYEKRNERRRRLELFTWRRNYIIINQLTIDLDKSIYDNSQYEIPNSENDCINGWTSVNTSKFFSSVKKNIY